VGISWPHRGKILVDTDPYVAVRRRGLLIGFSEPMRRETLDRFTVELYARVQVERNDHPLAYQWVGIVCTINPIAIEAECGRDLSGADFDSQPPDDKVLGVQIHPLKDAWPKGDYLVVLRGDAILAREEGARLDGTTGPRALDGNHLAPGLPDRCPTGDHIEGGTFESWFEIGND
jgi:hypothetical protein